MLSPRMSRKMSKKMSRKMSKKMMLNRQKHLSLRDLVSPCKTHSLRDHPLELEINLEVKAINSEVINSDKITPKVQQAGHHLLNLSRTSIRLKLLRKSRLRRSRLSLRLEKKLKKEKKKLRRSSKKSKF